MIYTTAVLNKNKNFYHHFGINKISAVLYGDKAEDIVNIEMRISDNQVLPEINSEIDSSKPDYWGWYDYKNNKFILIYPAYFLLNMCFPSGIKVEENLSRGKAYRLEIVKIEKY